MRESYDVIVAGAGIAGLHLALCLDKHISVLILSKNNLLINNTSLAQGGVAAVLDRQDDNEELHFEDTMVAGGFTNNREAVRVLVDNGPENVLGLLKYGVEFDKKSDGRIDLTLEGGHSRRRIAHHSDSTGYELETRLVSAAASRQNMDILQSSALLRLSKENDRFHAGILSDGKLLTFTCGAFVMATGGVGQVYKYSTNSAIATGDGIYLASKIGAAVRNLNLVQFHPTAFAGEAVHQRFLISESVRGEGGVLLNCEGNRFMHNYDSRLELAPRDVVSKAIISEAQRLGSEDFYLDITAKKPHFVKNRFPGIYAKCLEHGIDITKDKIPIFPCHHYLMGGINVDTYARTSIKGLYAVGECAHTGVHGNNRLASNSLLEALVFSRRAASDITENLKPATGVDGFAFTLEHGKPVPAGIPEEIQSIMQSCFFVNADLAACQKHLPRILEICEELKSGYEESIPLLEARSLSYIAKETLTEVIKKCR